MQVAAALLGLAPLPFEADPSLWVLFHDSQARGLGLGLGLEISRIVIARAREGHVCLLGVCDRVMQWTLLQLSLTWHPWCPMVVCCCATSHLMPERPAVHAFAAGAQTHIPAVPAVLLDL